MAKLISFDIDGTLEVGDPPGIVTIDMVKRAQKMGWVIGSCSDRPISDQQQIWERHDVPVDFIVLKQQLSIVRDRFEAEDYFHIGDTEVDRWYAADAGFEFIRVQDTSEPWLVDFIG